MLLSRFAESLYWSGRYLERAEATSRMIKVHTELFLDLPRSAGVGWSPLLAVTGSSEEFLGRHAGPEEEDAVAFLATDPKNLGSILASIAQARVNLRVSRVLLPGSCWEVVTDLHGWASATSAEAINRRSRLQWMDSVISDCQLLAGLLAGTMCDDEAYAFLLTLPLGRCGQIQQRLRDLTITDIAAPGDLHELADDLESGIGELHDALVKAYFRPSPEPAMT